MAGDVDDLTCRRYVRLPPETTSDHPHTNDNTIITSVEVMFSSAYVCLARVCLLAGLSKNYSTDFHKLWWKDGTRAMEETVMLC